MNRLKLILLALLLIGAVQTVGLSAQRSAVLTGIFSTIYADHPEQPYIIYQLAAFDGQRYTLSVDESVLEAAGGLLALTGQAVSVELNAPPPASSNAAQAGGALSVKSLIPLGAAGAAPAGQASLATTSQTWLNLLCKFSDIATEYHTQAEINALFANTYPLLDHYWRETSFNQISVANPSTRNWVSLPHPRSHYFVSGVTLDLSSILTDCVAAYGSAFNVSNFYGINLFLNGDLGGYFYGSWCMYVSLQGKTNCWRATWLPTTWSDGFYQDVLAHEMGHALGLPHSNNSDGDTNPYDNFYDLMSGHACGVWLTNYSCIGQHLISPYKDMLGWLAPAQKFTLSSAGTYTITLDRLAMSNPSNYYAAFVPIDANHYFTVEARRNSDNDYDKTLLDSGVIIHEVITSRSEPAWLVNGVSDDASRTGPGVWVPGETYTNYTYGFSVTVNTATPNGYSVTLKKGGIPATRPDLSVTLQDATTQPNKAVFQASVSNTGTGTATGVTLLLTTTYNLASLTSDPALDCTDTMCTLGNLAAGETRNYTLSARALSGGSTSVQLIAALNETDPTPANNTASVTTSLTVAPDIQLTMTHDADVVDVYGTMVNRIRAENVGGAAATNLTLTISLPSGVEDGGYGWGYWGSGSNCQVSGRTYTCTDASMNPGEYLYLNLYSYSATEASYTFTASATISNQDANPADNSASLITVVGTSLGVQAKVTLQGRTAAPNAGLVVPLSVVVTPSGGSTPVVNTTVTTDQNGEFSLSGLGSGSYRIWVKHGHSLATVTTVTLPTASVIDLGTLPEGDADGNNVVNLTDFSTLAATFGKQSGGAGYDGRADFNGDGIVNLTDFSLLASNFGKVGAVP